MASSKEETSKKQRRLPHFGHVMLSPIETAFNWLVWMPLNLLPFYIGYKLSIQRKKELFDLRELTPSWLGYEKDANDYEWNFWYGYTVMFMLSFLSNSTLVLIAKQKCPRYLNEVMILSALALHSLVMSWKGVAVIICQIMLFYGVTLLKSRVWTWFCTILMIIAVNTDAKAFIRDLISMEENDYNMCILSFMMSILRLVSFGCYVLESRHGVGGEKDNPEKKYNGEGYCRTLSYCLSYTLYVPMFYNGPVITYDVFIRDISKYTCTGQFQGDEGKEDNQMTVLVGKLPGLLKEFTKCVLHCLGFEVFLHFIYVNALSRNHWMLEDMSGLDVVAMSWIHLHIFNIKYYIFYRLTGLFAKLDGIEPPGPPKCIASLYTFVDMWRTFDKGLYRLLQQCIYFPLGGSRAGLSRQVIASCLCFSFVGLWHGGNKTMMFWALTNWVGIVAETIVGRIASALELRQHLSRAMYRRLCAAGGSLSVFGLIYTNMVFLIGYEGATILLSRVFVTWYAPFVILLVLYFTNQCSIDVN